MIWTITALISSCILLFGILASTLSWANRKKTRFWLAPSKILFVTVLASAITWFLPYSLMKTENWWLAIESSLQYAISLFAVNDGFFDLLSDLQKFSSIDTGSGFLLSYIENLLNTPWNIIFYGWYAGLGISLFIFAPVLTFHFILTFFKNLAAYSKYLFSPKKNVHIFSELNERSLALAKSMTTKEYRRTHRGKAVLIFADILDKSEEAHLDLVAEARHIGAILFRKDICSIFFPKHGTKSFYLISDDEAEKTRHTTHIIQRYRKCKNTRLYVFSDNTESKCFLDSYTVQERQEMALKVIRVNDIRSLVYHNLGCNGLRLFEHAAPAGDGTFEISALIVGLGRYGMEMLKALLWYCQFPGYSVRITAIDESADAESRFSAACHEISLQTYKRDANDMKYYVDVKTAKAGTEAFRKVISDLCDRNATPTYVFVCLGSDAINISTALDVRCQLAGFGKFPDIETVVYDPSLKDRVNMEWDKHTDTKNDMQKFDIHVVGDLDGFYSYNTVINSDMIEQGYAVHARWESDDTKNPENNFYMNDYNFFSSMASTLHRNLRTRIGKIDQSKQTFPSIYSDNPTTALAWDTPSAFLNVLRGTDDLEKLKALSSKMNFLADRLYSKLAELHYKKLSPEDRAEVLACLRKAVEGKYKSAPTPKKSKKVPPIPTELRLLQQLEDDPSHLCGIDSMLGAYLVDESDVKMCKKCQKRKKFDRCGKCGKRTKCGMALEWENALAERAFIRKMFRHIVETQYAKQPTNTYKPTFKLGFELESLSDREKQDVRSFIAACGINDLDECITMSRSFAYIEHIRWNAYMRTEGYSFCNNFTPDLKKYKLHGNLVPVDELTFDERIKDI